MCGGRVWSILHRNAVWSTNFAMKTLCKSSRRLKMESDY
jgi:hypothetical protein